MQRPSPRVLDIVGTVIRLGLASIWLVSGFIKASDPDQTYVAVQAYELFPTALVEPIAIALPITELILGIFVLVGLFTRLSALLSMVVLVLFIAGIVQAWARGLSIDCGCFGGGGQVGADQTQYLREIGLDIGYLLLALWLAWRPRTILSLDRRLGLGARHWSGNENVSSTKEGTA